MECRENLYLLIREDGLYYLLPVSCAEKVSQDASEDGLKVVDLSERAGDRKTDCSKKGRYCITICSQSGRLALLTEEITGIIECEEDNIFSPQMSGYSRRSRCFSRVARLEEQENQWGYILNPEGLIDGENSENDSGEMPEEFSDTGNHELAYAQAPQSCIALTSGKRQFYVSEKILASVVLKPRIQRIPGAPEWIAGPSDYEGRPVVYYDPAGIKRESPAEEYLYGVVIHETDGSLSGIAGELLGEGGGGGEDLRPVRDGIWERNCDQADGI